MPSSKNRRHIEIPVELYERLRHEASRRGVPLIALASDLLARGLAGMEPSASDTPASRPASAIYGWWPPRTGVLEWVLKYWSMILK